MKTYVLDTLNRFKRFSQKLDVTTNLCNRTWVVFNDSGERELYIFQPDGSLIITNNGIGIEGKWQWIPANNSLIIKRDRSILMLHPQFIDEVIFALNLDGTNQTTFLIEECNRSNFAPKGLTQLKGYFEEKERLLLAAEAEQQRFSEEQKRKEEAKQREQEEQRRKEEIKRKAQEEYERKREQARIRKLQIEQNARRIRKSLIISNWVLFGFILLSFGIGGLIDTLISELLHYSGPEHFLLCFIILPIITYYIIKFINYYRISKFKKKHPNAPESWYL